MPRFVWKDRNYVLAFEYAKSGLSNIKIAKAIGVTITTFNKWLQRRPALRFALKRGRRGQGRRGTETLNDYIYKRLSPKMQKLWDFIDKWDQKKNGILRIDAMLEQHGKVARQHMFLHAFITSNFNFSEACRKVNLSERQFDAWKINDPDFAELVHGVTRVKKDFMENALMDLIDTREPSAVIFANKTYNADRGYSPKIHVEHSGTVEHTHALVAIDTLPLDMDVKKQLLKAIKQQEQEELKNIVEPVAIKNVEYASGNGKHTDASQT